MELEFDCVAGRGLFGEVWRATDILKRELAVKFIVGADALEERLALNHAAALARVRHPRVVHLLALEQQTHPETGETHLALIMDFIPGACLNTTANLSYAEARTIARDVTDALEAIHAAQIIHGDLHSGNIMISDGRATVIDMLYTRSLADIRTTMAARDRDQDYRDLVQILRIVFDKAGVDVQTVETFVAKALMAPRGLDGVRTALSACFPSDVIPNARPPRRAPAQTPNERGEVFIEDYEKDGRVRSFVVKGDTMPLREDLKGLGGRWIRTLGGWVFPKTKQAAVERLLEERRP